MPVRDEFAGGYPQGVAFVNVGTGEDMSIRESADLVANPAGYDGLFVFDADRPEGTPQKLLDISKMSARALKADILLQEAFSEYSSSLRNMHDKSSLHERNARQAESTL